MHEQRKAGFFGSGIFAAKCLRMIHEQHPIDFVITNAAKPSGRGLTLKNTPVYDVASELGIECRTVNKLSTDTETEQWIIAKKPDVILVIDFGHMVKEPYLSLTKLGCINIHPSKLPQYRGSAPLQRAIADGLDKTAVTLFKLDEGMDSGPILSQPEILINKNDTYETLIDKSASAGCKELLRFLNEIPDSQWQFVNQPAEGISYAPKIDKAEGKIDWNSSADNISCLIRGMGSSPGTFCIVKGKRLRLYEAEISELSGKPGEIVATDQGRPIIACGSGALVLFVVQNEGKKIQNASEWFRGARLKIGDTIID